VKHIPPYVVFAICGVLFLSMGMFIITADSEPTAPTAATAPEADATMPTLTATLTIEAVVEPVVPSVEPPVEQVVPPPDAAVPEPVAPPAEVVVQPPAAPVTDVQPVEVQPVQPTPVEIAPIIEGAPVAEGFSAAIPPTSAVPAQQPTVVVATPADLQVTPVAPIVASPVPVLDPIVVPATSIPAEAAQPLGTLPPPANVIPPTAAPLPAQVYGQVVMPLRTDFTGVAVTLSLTGGSALQTLTDSRGVFTFVNLQPGNYRVDAGMTGYLTSQFVFALGEGQSLTLPPATLIGGDTNFDNRIDLSDAVLIAANFNLAVSTPADLNNDGVVDIRDLTVIGTYFGKAGPVSWQ
jgi:Carboxypeptidase regulatory-like domain